VSVVASKHLPPAAEGTEIPVDGPMRMYGAAAYLAALAYPGTAARDHARRDQLITAVTEWIRGHHVYRTGQRRTTAKRRAAAGSDWLQAPRVMGQRQMHATINRATRVIHQQRLFCAAVARQWQLRRAAPFLATAFARSLGVKDMEGVTATISGPHSFTQILLSSGWEYQNIHERQIWRCWRETLPVLHLALAIFEEATRKPADDERPDFMMRMISRTDHWLARAVEGSEANALLMTDLVTGYDPSTRIQLVAAK